MSEEKTNAMRMLDRAKICYRMHTYAAEDGAIDGVSVAKKVGADPRTVFKTLVTVGHSRSCYVFVIPVAGELDLKRAAKSVGEKSVQMLPLADLTRVTGYVRGGCSPVGMKKRLVTRIDASAEGLETMLVSGGRIGTQIEIAPADLLRATGADFAALTAGS